MNKSCSSWLVGQLGWFVLMFCTGSASMAEVHDVSIYSWPVHCRVCQLLHPLNPKMPQMRELQNLGPQDGGNDDSGPLQMTSAWAMESDLTTFLKSSIEPLYGAFDFWCVCFGSVLRWLAFSCETHYIGNNWILGPLLSHSSRVCGV